MNSQSPAASAELSPTQVAQMLARGDTTLYIRECAIQYLRELAASKDAAQDTVATLGGEPRDATLTHRLAAVSGSTVAPKAAQPVAQGVKRFDLDECYNVVESPTGWFVRWDSVAPLLASDRPPAEVDLVPVYCTVTEDGTYQHHEGWVPNADCFTLWAHRIEHDLRRSSAGAGGEA